MVKRWVRQRKKDSYYRMAKAKGYRSRAAFKLIQINKRFELIREGDVVVDLGAAPGGWSQVALELVGAEGKVIAVDKKRMSPIEGVQIIRGDLTEENTVALALDKMGGKADAVISDTAPRLSGNRHIDHAKSVSLAKTALEFAEKTISKRGNFVAKIFQGDMFKDYRDKVAGAFKMCQSYSPKASTSGSREVFVVGKGYLI